MNIPVGTDIMCLWLSHASFDFIQVVSLSDSRCACVCEIAVYWTDEHVNLEGERMVDGDKTPSENADLCKGIHAQPQPCAVLSTHTHKCLG